MNTLTVIFLLCSTTLPTVLTVESNITLVLRDLSALARITNAIYLASQNVFDDAHNVDDAIAEVAQFNRTALSALMDPDVASILEHFQQICDLCAEIKKSDQTIGSLSGFDKFSEYLLSGMNGIEEQERSIPMKLMGSYDIDGLLENFDAEDYVICNETDLARIVAFRRIDKEVVERPPMFLDRAFRGFRHSLPYLMSCISKLPSFGQKTSILKKSLAELSAMTKVRDILIELSKPKKIEIFVSQFVQLKDSFVKTENDVKKIPNGRMNESIANLKTVYEKIIESSLVRRKLTNGFSEPEDMSRVVEDVNSKWFREKVAEGKSTEQLASALAPFQKYGEKVKELYNAYDSFMSISQNQPSLLIILLEIYQSAFTSLEGIPDMTRIADSIKKANDAFTTCRANADPIDNHELVNFEEAIFLGGMIDERLNALVNQVNEFVRDTDLDQLNVSLGRLKTKLDRNMPEDSNDIRQMWRDEIALLGADGSMVRSALDKLEMMYEKQNEVRFAIATFIRSNLTSRDIDLSEKMGRLAPYLVCLMSQKYDSDMIKKLAELHVQISRLAAGGHDQFKLFVRKLGAIQKQVREVQQAAAKVSTKGDPPRRATAEKIYTKLNVSQSVSVYLGNAVEALSKMSRLATTDRMVLENCTELSDTAFKIARQFHDRSVREIWGDKERATGHMDSIFGGVAKLTEYCGTIVGKDALGMKAVFSEAAKVPGIPVKQETMVELTEELRKSSDPSEAEALLKLQQLGIDFDSYKSDLTGAEPAVTALQTMFDDYFGNTKTGQGQVVVQNAHSGTLIVTIVAICVGVIVLILISICVGYGMTKSGRNRYTNAYLFYFGKPEEFEKRWRYSMFRDRTDGENALIDATREVNLENVQKALQKGAYINVYNKFGNTPLHTVARLGHADLVATLIKNGADRTLLNARNRTAEQMVPAEKEEKYAECARLFAKYRHKKFRVRVPEVFPVSSFHIYIEERTNDLVTDEFMNKFKAITSEELLATNTHCVVKVDEAGVLVTDEIHLLFGIFNGVIFVKEAWMKDCVRDEKLIEQDYNYLVTSVKYKGTLLENVVVPWTEAKAKSSMPFLYGVFVVFVMETCPNIETLSSIIIGNGGKVLDAFPEKTQFNQGSHPYLHAHLGPLFVIHDGKTPALQNLKGDPMFTVLTEDEFVLFMLRRQVYRVKGVDPIPVLPEEDRVDYSQVSSTAKQSQTQTRAHN